MRAQGLERQLGVNRCAVVQNVQVTAFEVDDAFSLRVLDEPVANVPLSWDRPVEHLRAGRHLRDLERDVLADSTKSVSDAVSRDTSADRIELRYKCVHLLPAAIDARAEGPN